MLPLSFKGSCCGGAVVLKSGWQKKVFVLGLIGLIFYGVHFFGLGQYLSLEALKEHQQSLDEFYQQQPLLMVGLFCLVYIVSTALSIPGALVLTLAGGALFGFAVGLVAVSLSSTIGATLAFLVSRFLLRDWVQSKFRDKLYRINRGVEKEGVFYLFTLRLVPLFPFFLINLVMGLTPIRTGAYFIVSLIGMLPGTAVYVNAGTQLARLDSLGGLLSPQLILSFALIGVLPLASKRMLDFLKARKSLRRFQRPKQFDFNMVVIGGGSAGLVSAYIAAAVKAKVALIEKHKMGGDCLNTGCVPSKALIRSAKILNYAKRAREFGLPQMGSGQEKADLSEVMDRVKKIIARIEPHDSMERYRGLGVDCFEGQAKILSPFEVQVGDRVLTTKNIVIATGAGPLIPDLPGLDQVGFLTSDNVWEQKELPKRLLVLGAGPIGCELAQAFSRLGSQVSLVEMGDRILGREDVEVSELVLKRFVEEGIEVKTAHRALRLEAGSQAQPHTLICEHQGQEVALEFDQILLALGRKANVTGFGLEELGVEISESGTLVADEFMRVTNYPNIYVCGDVTGPFQFTHVASHQAWFVAVNALFSPFKRFVVDYRVIPWCTFVDPEVARVGVNEEEAKERGIDYQVTRYSLEGLDRAIADGEAHGFVKVLTPPGSDRILGATIVGPHAGDIMAEYVLAMKYGLGLNKILGTIHIYPTLAEANKFAAGVWKKATAPQGALRWLERFHSWRRS